MSTTQSFVCREKPTKTAPKVFVLANTPTANSEQVFLNGVLQNFGPDNDYTISNKTITFNTNTQIDDTDVILVNYLIDVVVPDYTPIQSEESLKGRRALVHWCLRRLGAPVIDINIDEDQIEDRIDEALLYFRDYHFDGIERVYLKYQITASHLVAETAHAGSLTRGDTLTGLSSGATGYAYDKSADNKIIRFRSTSTQKFTKGEVVQVGDDTSNTFEILNSDSAVFTGDVDNHYLNIGTKVISVTNIIPQESSTIGGNLGGMFDFQYQFALNNMFNLASTDLITYQIYKQYISQWEFMFRGTKGIRFNRKTDRIYLDVQDWVVDQWIIIEAWSALDPNIYTEIYSDEFVREYAFNLIKMQWGANLKKFSGIQLPGGVTLNGQQIYDEAIADLEKLRERVRKEFELPPDFFVG
jgi:hypothetical protein